MSTGRPVWDDDASAEAFWDALPARVDVAVVGAGLAGLSAAYHAKQLTPDRQVAVLEAGRIGAGASGRSTGMVGPGVDYMGIAKQVMRPDLYEEAMKEIGYAHGGASMSPETLFDGKVFDPANPEAYASGFEVHNLKA